MFFSSCVLQRQNNKKQLLVKGKWPEYFLHIFIETLPVCEVRGFTPTVNISVTNRQTERLYWRAVFIMKQYWDQIETVVTWWLIPPLWSLPPHPDTPPAQLISPQMPSSGPGFFRTASKSSGHGLLPPCSPISRVHPSIRPSVSGMPA